MLPKAGLDSAYAFPAMHMHASCAARDGIGVLLIGPAGTGKSDLLLRLLGLGFTLVADDQVEIQGTQAWPPERLAGLMEVRGLGIVRLPYAAPVRVALAVELTTTAMGPPDRMPGPRREPRLGVPLVQVDARAASAPQRVVMALDCATGRVTQLSGAFAP